MQKLENLGNYLASATRQEIEAEIIEYSNSVNGLNRLNSILFGAKYGVRAERFITRLIDMSTDNATTFFGTPMSSFAKAALDILGVEKYTGDDDYIRIMIDSGFRDI